MTQSEADGTTQDRDFGSILSTIRQILGLARPYRLSFATGFLLFLISTGLSLVLPLGIKLLLDNALAQQDARMLHLLTVGLLSLFILRFGVAYLGSYLLLIVGEKVSIDLRSRLFDHLQTLDVAFFRSRPVGDLVSRLTNDAGSIRTAVNQSLVTSVLTLFQVVVAMVIMVVLNWRLAVIVGLAAPTATLLSRHYGPKLQAVSHEAMERIGRAVGFLQEVLNGMPVVQAFDRKEHEGRRFRRHLADLLDTAKRSARVNALFRSLVNLATTSSNIALFWFGGLEVLAGRLTVGDLVAFLFYSQSVASGISQLAQHYGDLSGLVGASHRVFQLLAVKPAIASRPDAVTLPSPQGRLALDGVTFSYGADRPVLSGVDLVFRPGETAGVVGLSGAGKTTLLQLLCRFYDPTGGGITFDGRDLRDLELGWLRRQVGLVSQDTFLFAGTVRDNILYGRLEASEEEVEAAARAAHAEEFILELPDGYETEIGERGIRLSGGQRQRLTLARALLKDAPVLILDEATSSVDTLSERLIQDALEQDRERRTTVIVAHRLATVRNADRIVVLDAGRVVDVGSHDELMVRCERYVLLIQAQVEAPPEGGAKRQAVVLPLRASS